MTNYNYEIDLGFIITKAPYESSLGEKILELANKGLDEGKTIGIFLISDGVWFAKKNTINKTGQLFKTLVKQGAQVTVSKDNLESAGIKHSELINGITISEKPYMDLVDLVMEKWRRVLTI
jgi:sulfur relay (sulfurtransferase) complex TusBCD TusD component (DsrE family)